MAIATGQSTAAVSTKADHPASQPTPAATSVDAILRLRVFEEPLVPIGDHPSAAENADLAGALQAYGQRSGQDDFGSLERFLQSHPESAWRASVLTGLGLEYYNTAHYSKALAAWQAAWTLAKDATDLKGKAVADRAVGELAFMYGRLGRMTELEALLQSVANRVVTGPATERLAGAREGLWNMQHRPEIAFRCGPQALLRIQKVVLPEKPADMTIFECASTQRGMSLPQVAALSDKIGLNYQMAFRERGGEFQVPSVVHWKLGHYAAIIRQEGDKYLVQDATFLNDVWATRAAIEAESSGYFLVRPGALPKGWRSVAAKEGENVWGKGNTQTKDPGLADPRTPAGPCKGMAVASVNLMLVSLHLQDEPVGYSPPVGPAVRFNVSYNHRDAFQPGTFTYANFGPKWTCEWLAYITDNPQNTSADVNYYVRGGGNRIFTGFNTNAQVFGFQQYDQTQLKRTGAASYEMRGRDGSKMVFAQSDGSLGTTRKVFLSQVIDAQGNAVTLNYDSNLRVTNIVDAIGQGTTITYSTNDIYKVVRVTDPFGRFATFDYDSLGRLTNITDVIGMSSRFTYESSSDYVNALITPYGTNSFLRGESGTTRWLETVYPDGSRDRVEFNQGVNVASSDPAGSTPKGMSLNNNFLNYRNTYYWSRTACASSYGDYSKARVYHWLHTADVTMCAGILESIKEPLEGRVWLDYAGQSDPIFVGVNNRPTHVGRVLDDGSTQLSTYGYNGFGNLTNSIDPLGRTFSYIYDTNGIDLLEVRMTRAGKNELLSKTTYNAQHLPLTTAGADGQTTTNTYNARGQLLTSTNPKGETTTHIYNPNGYLIAIDGPLPGTNDMVFATYDALGRTQTKTDDTGYSLTLEHDALDRITKITFPDATFDQITYDRLDAHIIQDRAGRQTVLEHTPLGQLAQRTDPLGRVTRFQWCSCGNVKSMTDPMGRTTEWETDVQGRLATKQYSDGSKVIYQYETTSGRLRQVIDEKQQVKQLTYNRDNTLRSINYLNTTVATPTVSYTYDPDYRRKTSMTDGIGTTIYAYNPITGVPSTGAGLLASIDGPLINDTIVYNYDELGRTVKTAIDGVAQSMVYDERGRITNQTNLLGGFGYIYDGDSSRVVVEVFPNGMTISNSFGGLLEDHRLMQIAQQIGTTAISKFNYGYDFPESRITTWSQQSGNAAPDLCSIGYDASDRLLSVVVTNSGVNVNAFTYSYDPVDNRLLETTSSTTNLATYNALNQIGTTSAPGSSCTNEWDAADRLVAVNTGNERTEFAYNGESRLASVRYFTNGMEVSYRRYLWCGQTICQERDASGASITKRFFSQGMKIESGPNIGSYFYTRDHLGSVRTMTDIAGAVRALYNYDPFGRQTRTAGDLDADFGFTGLLNIREVGLSAARLRIYAPALGRWLSRDPLHNAERKEGVNLYAYVRNDPINKTDLSGLAASCCEDEFESLQNSRIACALRIGRAAKDCNTASKYTPEIAVEVCQKEFEKASLVCKGYSEIILDNARALFACLKENDCEPDGPCAPPPIPDGQSICDTPVGATFCGGGKRPPIPGGGLPMPRPFGWFPLYDQILNGH